MEFIKKEDLAKKVNSNMTTLDVIDLKYREVGSLIDSLDDREDAEPLADLLNKINNQGIYDINIHKYTYMHLGKKLWFDDLSTAEKVFLLAYAANKLKRTIYFNYDIKSLTKTTLKLFIKTFYSSPYVNVMYDEDKMTNFYNFMIKEALK